jgi:hypothetical protein
VQSRLLKCTQLMSLTACGLTPISDHISVMFPTICLLHILLNLQSLVHFPNSLSLFSSVSSPYTSSHYYSFVPLCILFIHNFTISICSLHFQVDSSLRFFLPSFVICLFVRISSYVFLDSLRTPPLTSIFALLL